MTSDIDFLRSIIAEPEDDDLRLVYADWLEEQGKSDRASFIRMQIELETLPESDPRRRELEQASHDICENHAGKWPGDVFRGNDFGTCNYERGFICCASFENGKDFLRSPNPLFDREPITCLNIWLKNSEIVPFANSPYLNRLTKVWLHQEDDGKGKPTVPRFDVILSSPHLTNLRGLGLCPADEARPDKRHETLRILTTRPEFANLKELRFDEYPLDDRGATMLANSQTLNNVRKLEISSNLIKATPLRILAESPFMAAVESLEITNYRRPRQPVDWVAALVDNRQLASLQSLEMDHNELGDAAVARLVAAESLRNLRSLNLNSNRLTVTAIHALAVSPLIESLESLELEDNRLGDPGVIALVRSPRLSKLKRLSLGSTRMRTASLQALVESPALQDIEELHLDECDIGTRGAELLAAAEWPRLHTLNISGCNIGDQGAAHLIASKTLPARFVEFSAYSNGISPESAAGLRERFGMFTQCIDDDDDDFGDDEYDDE